MGAAMDMVERVAAKAVVAEEEVRVVSKGVGQMVAITEGGRADEAADAVELMEGAVAQAMVMVGAERASVAAVKDKEGMVDEGGDY